MNSGPTSERVYAAVKRLILERAFRPGERLDPARLGDALHASVTPVRDALHLLAGEGLVETRTHEGFQLPMIDAPSLQDLYAWNGEVLMLAIRRWGLVTARLAPRDRPPTDPATRVAALFATIAAYSANAEHAWAIGRANDRLHAARLAESERLEGVEPELDELSGAIEATDASSLRRRLAAYHRRRIRAAADIVRALYRGPAPTIGV